jgi:hypothetical protein
MNTEVSAIAKSHFFLSIQCPVLVNRDGVNTFLRQAAMTWNCREPVAPKTNTFILPLF